MTSIRPSLLNHMNVVLEDFQASVAHFQRYYDAEFMVDIPNPETQAGLIEIGRTIFEIFVPRAWLLTARYGAHYVGVEYRANIEEVRAAVAERGIRIVRDIGLALHTHPEDTLGVAFEFYDGDFHWREWDELGGRQIHPAEYWLEHPLGITGLKCFTLAVEDLAKASTFLQGFLSAEVVYEVERPALSARAIGLKVADGVIELQAPDGPGELQRHLYRYGEGIRSTVFAVRNIAATARFLGQRGVEAVPGSMEASLTVPAAANLGVIFEFAE
jgi:hypothetical protein